MAEAQHQIQSPIMGTIFQIKVSVGDAVQASTEVLIVESMKMEHPVEAGCDGVIAAIGVNEGDTVSPGQPLITVTPGIPPNSFDSSHRDNQEPLEREDFSRYQHRRYLTTDAARPR